MQFYQINLPLPGEKKFIKSTDTVSTNNSSIGAVQCKSMQRKIFIWFICSLFEMLQKIDFIYFLFAALFLYYCINNAEERYESTIWSHPPLPTPPNHINQFCSKYIFKIGNSENIIFFPLKYVFLFSRIVIFAIFWTERNAWAFC